MILLSLFTASSVSFAQDAAVIKTDLKVICQINKMEKALSKDKSINGADLAERIATLKEHGLKDPATKNALSAIATMAPADQIKTWKQFAKDNKVNVKCLQ